MTMSYNQQTVDIVNTGALDVIDTRIKCMKTHPVIMTITIQARPPQTIHIARFGDTVKADFDPKTQKGSLWYSDTLDHDFLHVFRHANTQENIERAYRARVKEIHPNKAHTEPERGMKTRQFQHFGAVKSHAEDVLRERDAWQAAENRKKTMRYRVASIFRKKEKRRPMPQLPPSRNVSTMVVQESVKNSTGIIVSAIRGELQARPGSYIERIVTHGGRNNNIFSAEEYVTTKSAIESIFDNYKKKMGNADRRLRAMCKKLRTIPRPSDVNALRNMYFEHVSRSNYIMRHLETQRALVKPKSTERMLLPAWPIRIRKSRRTGEWLSEMAPDVEAFYTKAGYERYTESKKAVHGAVRQQQNAANRAIAKDVANQSVRGAVLQQNAANRAIAKDVASQAVRGAVLQQNAANRAIAKDVASQAVRGAVLQQNAAKTPAMSTYMAGLMHNMERIQKEKPHLVKNAIRVFPSPFYSSYWKKLFSRGSSA